MVDSRLVTYIQQQLKAGYDGNTIRNALLQNNYPAQEIDAALQAAGGFSQQQIQQLAGYVSQNLAKGYSPQQIQQFLLQQGYPQAAVNSAVRQATRKPFHFPAKILLILFLALLITAVLGATVWFFMNIEPSEKTEPTFDISVDVDTLAPGETLYINNDFRDFPTPREYPITLYYVLNDATGTRGDSWQISMGINDGLVKNTKYLLRTSIVPGKYSLDATLNYGALSKQASAAFTVSVNEEEITAAEQAAEQVQIIEETEVVETPSSTEEETTEQTEVVETTQEAILAGKDDYKNLANAKEIAPTDPATALQYCALISTQTKIDECYWNVAKYSGDKSYCEIIVADHTRDSCWIGFAFEKSDYTVCENISNPFLKQSCDQLKKVAELQAMQ